MRSRAGAAALLLLLALAPWAASPAHARQAPGREAGGAGAVAAQTPAVRLLSRTPWVGEGLDFQLSVQVAAAPAGATVRLQVHDRVRSRSEFARTVAGEELRSVRWVEGPRPVGTGAGPVTFTVPIAPAEGRTVAPIDDPGVYPVSLHLFAADGEQLAALHTHLVRLAPFDPSSEELPLRVAVVARLGDEPIGTEPLDRPAGNVPDALVDTATALTAALAAHPDLAINLSLLPENLAALAAERPDLATELATTLAGSDLLVEPWVPVDAAAWAAADPALLAQLESRARAAVRDALGLPRVPVSLAGGASLASLREVAGRGTELLVVDEEDLVPLDTGDFPYTLARPFRLDLEAAGDGAGDEADEDDGDGGGGATVAAVAADAALGAHAARAGDDPVLAASLVLADLAVIAADEPSSDRLAVVRLPASATASPEFLDTLLTGLEPPEAPPPPPPPQPDPETGEVPEPAPPVAAAAPRLQAGTLTAAVDAVAAAGAGGILAGPDEPLVRRLAEGGSVGDVAALAEALAAARVDLASYRSIFGEADPAAARASALLDTLAADAVGAGAREAALRSVADHIGARLAAIEAPELQRVTLTDREGLVQLVFANATGMPADVRLVVRADRLVLPEAPEGELAVRLEPDVTRVELQVEARSSGDARLDIQVTSPDGRLDVAETSVVVRTTAVSGVGLVLMVGALAFLAVWWTRTIVRERRSRRAPAHARRS